MRQRLLSESRKLLRCLALLLLLLLPFLLLLLFCVWRLFVPGPDPQSAKMMNNYGNIMMDSPRSSPHGGRSPVVARQDSSGTLKTTISLGKTPTIIHTGPFYSMKEPPAKAELTGDKDLMTEYGLHHTLTKFKEKKFKESLASFLPNIPGINDLITHPVENSTLRSVIEKPPIGGKELLPLTAVQLAGFRLHPGPVSCNQYSFNFHLSMIRLPCLIAAGTVSHHICNTCA